MTTVNSVLSIAPSSPAPTQVAGTVEEGAATFEAVLVHAMSGGEQGARAEAAEAKAAATHAEVKAEPARKLVEVAKGQAGGKLEKVEKPAAEVKTEEIETEEVETEEVELTSEEIGAFLAVFLAMASKTAPLEVPVEVEVPAEGVESVEGITAPRPMPSLTVGGLKQELSLAVIEALVQDWTGEAESAEGGEGSPLRKLIAEMPEGDPLKELLERLAIALEEGLIQRSEGGESRRAEAAAAFGELMAELGVSLGEKPAGEASFDARLVASPEISETIPSQVDVAQTAAELARALIATGGVTTTQSTADARSEDRLIEAIEAAQALGDVAEAGR